VRGGATGAEEIARADATFNEVGVKNPGADGGNVFATGGES
jgi:hypothetical protein